MLHAGCCRRGFISIRHAAPGPLLRGRSRTSAAVPRGPAPRVKYIVPGLYKWINGVQGLDVVRPEFHRRLPRLIGAESEFLQDAAPGSQRRFKRLAFDHLHAAIHQVVIVGDVARPGQNGKMGERPSCSVHDGDAVFHVVHSHHEGARLAGTFCVMAAATNRSIQKRRPCLRAVRPSVSLHWADVRTNFDLQSSSFASSPGNSTSVNPNRDMSAIRIG